MSAGLVPGNRATLELLTPIVYDELRRENAGHTLQATALVHEAYPRLFDQRRILVDHARARRAAKRGSGVVALSLDEALGVAEKKKFEMIALDDALRTLANVDAQQAQIVEMRFFTGLTIEETAEAWLFREMSRQP